jgi:hypothetical protein
MSRLAGLAEGSALAANILFAGRADALRELTARMCSPTCWLPTAAKPAASADVVEDDAARGALAAQPKTPAPSSRLAVRRPDARWEAGALAAHVGICAGGGQQSPSLSRPQIGLRVTGSKPTGRVRNR